VPAANDALAGSGIDALADAGSEFPLKRETLLERLG
jgi:hypothetical protein